MVTKKRVCVVTGSRAEYGLLRHLMDAIRASGSLSLQLIVTGMHLSPEFGSTYREIEGDGFRIDRKVEMLLSSDTPTGIAKSTGLGIIGLAEAFDQLKPDLIVLLGDRFEILSAAIAAMYARIPIAHLHGGETTLGAFDEGIRHSITKMSHLHFVATETYRNRVIQLGESPDRVFNVGGLGVDAMQQMELLNLEDLEKQLRFRLGNKALLITFHPVTLETCTAEQQLTELLFALERLDTSFRFVMTYPNADTDGRRLTALLNDFANKQHHRSLVVASLGQPRYWSVLKHAAAVVGNSSSGLLEAPSFCVPAVNIGDRQSGRVKADSVIDCQPVASEIFAAIQRAVSPEFQTYCQKMDNPYGNGGAARSIVDVLCHFPLHERMLKKGFVDLPVRS